MDTITFDPVAKTVTVQPPTPDPTVIDGAHYLAELEDTVTLHTANIGLPSSILDAAIAAKGNLQAAPAQQVTP